MAPAVTTGVSHQSSLASSIIASAVLLHCNCDVVSRSIVSSPRPGKTTHHRYLFAPSTSFQKDIDACPRFGAPLVNPLEKGREEETGLVPGQKGRDSPALYPSEPLRDPPREGSVCPVGNRAILDPREETPRGEVRHRAGSEDESTAHAVRESSRPFVQSTSPHVLVSAAVPPSQDLPHSHVKACVWFRTDGVVDVGASRRRLPAVHLTFHRIDSCEFPRAFDCAASAGTSCMGGVHAPCRTAVGAHHAIGEKKLPPCLPTRGSLFLFPTGIASRSVSSSIPWIFPFKPSFRTGIDWERTRGAPSDREDGVLSFGYGTTGRVHRACCAFASPSRSQLLPRDGEPSHVDAKAGENHRTSPLHAQVRRRTASWPRLGLADECEADGHDGAQDDGVAAAGTREDQNHAPKGQGTASSRRQDGLAWQERHAPFQETGGTRGAGKGSPAETLRRDGRTIQVRDCDKTHQKRMLADETGVLTPPVWLVHLLWWDSPGNEKVDTCGSCMQAGGTRTRRPWPSSSSWIVQENSGRPGHLVRWRSPLHPPHSPS